MADYIYLLESRLSPAQQQALQAIRELARAKGLTVFLVGGAVRDLTNGSPVRDLDVAVQGNALKLKKDLEKSGASVVGESELMQALFVRFPGNVRVEIGSTLSVEYPKPGKPVVKPANILEDLRRRDFTANAMALSLNEGSYGLLMDPLNGVADIENRELRLISNYGFIEDPVRMIRAIRLSARLGWQLEEKTRARYDTGKAEGYISALSSFQRGYELEEIAHEDDPLRVISRLEQEGWMQHLSPAWASAKVNTAELERLRETQMQLQIRGINADISATQFPILTGKMQQKDVVGLKKSFPRRDLVEDIDLLEAEGKKFAAELGSKNASTPSAAWKLIMATRPEVVLWVAFTTKSAALQTKFKQFYTEWPQARQRIPYALMQEMRIVPELPEYDQLVEKLYFELMDGKLATTEEMKAFLEPYSPPAPPPPVHLRRARSARKEPKAPRGRKKAETPVSDELESAGEEVVVAASESEDFRSQEAPKEKRSPGQAKTSHVKPVAAKAKPAKTQVSKPHPAKTSAKVTKPKVAAKTKTAVKLSKPKPSAKTMKPAPKKVARPAPAKAKANRAVKPAKSSKVVSKAAKHTASIAKKNQPVKKVAKKPTKKKR